jgi:hypothetical protein
LALTVAADVKTAANATVIAEDWQLVGYSVKLNNDGITNDINFRVGNGTDDDILTTTNLHYYHQFVIATRSNLNLIGTSKTNTTFATNFIGFIYAFYVTKGSVAATTEFPHKAATCDGCTPDTCVDVAT